MIKCLHLCNSVSQSGSKLGNKAIFLKNADGIGDAIREFGKDILHKFPRKDIDDLAKEFPKFYSSDIGFSFP
jgi:hypothetical protein